MFVHDRQSGVTSRVSVASDGTQGNHYSGGGLSLSADGRYVAFVSFASNLVSGDTNGIWDVFVHDRQTGVTSRVSVASDGTQGNDHSSTVGSLSADGRYVAFYSYASNLVSGDTNRWDDVFVHGPAKAVYLPLILGDYFDASDLVVESLLATSDVVTLTIRNQGNVPATQGFWVDVYFNPSVRPSLNRPWNTIASPGIVWGVTTPIAANGGTLTLTTGGDYYFPEYSSPAPWPVGADVYALVDSINFDTSYGTVLESDEGNNLYGPATSSAGVAGEAMSAGSRGQSPSREGLPPRQ
jgi:hypothetical protein